MAPETERPEAVEAGTVVMGGVCKKDIIDRACELLDDENIYKKMAQTANPYGDGSASKRIVEAILYAFGQGEKPVDLV